jgi:LPS-assembly protein
VTPIRTAPTILCLLLFAVAPVRADDRVECPQPPGPATPEETPADDAASTGPITIESDADDFEFDVAGNGRLCGNVQMRQGNRVIRADCLQYDARSQSAKLEGGVEYSDPRAVIRGNNGSYSPALGTTLEGAEFELPESHSRGAARSLGVSSDGRVTLRGAWFTTCPAEDMAWQIRGEQIDLDTRAQNGTVRSARVRFKNVPILYLPWMSFPLGPQRKSGFLAPYPTNSSRSGAQLEVPYYWNIRPNADLTARPVYYARRGIDLGGEFRYLTPRQRGSVDFNYLPDDREFDDGARHHVRLRHLAELPGDWRFRIDATDVGDSDYFEDFAIGPEGTSVPFTERLAEATYRDEHLNVRAQLQHFQTIDEELVDELRPYARTPRVLASGGWDLGLGAIDYGFDAELVNFERNTGVTGWRFDVAPRAGFDWSAPGFFLRPSAGYRYTQYSLRDVAPGADDAPTRSLPFASLDSGLVFERSAGSHGQRRLTLEPRALYLYTPFREQSGLPLFDTGLPDLNLVQLFRTNRYVGADRVNDANQISVGVTSRLFDGGSGAQYLAVSLGQSYYFEQPRVVLPNETPSTRDTSDFIAQLSLTAYKDWNLEAGIQWNPEDTRSERSQFRVQYRPGGDRVVNLAYRALRDRLEQADASLAWPLGQRWNAFGRAVYSLRDSEMLDRFVGFEYEACCYRLRLVAQRSVSNRNGGQTTGVYLQLELSGLGNVGSRADAFLERSIRGYSPETSRR